MLAEYRKEIDEIDQSIIELLAKRFEVVQKVGAYKKTANIPPLQPARWQEVLANRTAMAEKYGLDTVFVTDIWNRIHEHALSLEK